MPSIFVMYASEAPPTDPPAPRMTSSPPSLPIGVQRAPPESRRDGDRRGFSAQCPGRARLSIEVRDAAGRTAEQAVEERLAEVAGYRVARSTTTVGGTEAIVLDPMPGQELSRQVLSPRATWPMN